MRAAVTRLRSHSTGERWLEPRQVDSDELAFYDAVSQNDSAVLQNDSAVLQRGEGVLAQIARDLVIVMRRDCR